MDNYKWTLTRRMDSVLNGLQKEFQALYTKEEFEALFVSLQRAGNQSNRPSILQDIYDKLEACNIPYEEGKDDLYYFELVKNSDIPSNFQEAEDKMIYALYNQYEEYATSEDYIQRMVDRLRNSSDHWEEDPLRLQILKQFVKYGDSLQTICGGAKYIKKYLEGKLGRKEIADAAEFADFIEDDIFSALKTAKEGQLKPNGCFAILKIVNDLANGWFRTGGGTKRNLYLFAMVYGMTYYSGVENGDIIDFKTDIEVNLFRDYYINNFIRFITQPFEENKTNYDAPSGQGINYKNFAEMICLYYISKNNYTPQEKIKLSNAMITRIVKRYKEGKWNLDVSSGNLNTSYYRGLVQKEHTYDMFCEDILNLSENDFEDFIINNYNCSTLIGKTEISPFQVATEQNTAFEEYEKIVHLLQDKGLWLENETGRYGFWIMDINKNNKKDDDYLLELQIEKICLRHPEIDRKSFDKFIDLFKGINYFLTRDKVKSSKDITRTDLITAYYYLFNDEQENRIASNIYLKKFSFDNVFRDFKNGIDEKLEAAGYQTLSSKNIFDVAVAFSSYAYLNI